MGLPDWLELILFVAALLAALVKLRYGLKAYNVRKSTFGGETRFLRLGLAINIGYALATLLLGIYFLLLFLGSTVSVIVFDVTVVLLVAIIAIEFAYRSRAIDKQE